MKTFAVKRSLPGITME